MHLKAEMYFYRRKSDVRLVTCTLVSIQSKNNIFTGNTKAKSWCLFYCIEIDQTYAKLSYSTGKKHQYRLNYPHLNNIFWTEYEPKYRFQA